MEIAASTARPKEALANRVYDSIQQLGYRRQLANVRCRSDGSTVVLQGLIGSFYLKQIAQSVAAKVDGVDRVVNQIEVVDARLASPR